MTVFAIDDFKLGLDVRKSILTAQPGSCQILDNCVVTPGGEIQKRKAFVAALTLTAGATTGLVGTTTGRVGSEQLYVFSAPASGTLNANNLVGTIGYRSSFSTPVYNQTLSNVPGGGTGTNSLISIDKATEYGASGGFAQFFVSGRAGGGGNYNWWLGSLVADYVGFQPLVSEGKMYRVNGPIVYFSGIGSPSATNPLNPGGTGPNTVNPGAGFIDMTRISPGTLWLTALGQYYKQIAVFSRYVCLLWQMDADPTLNSFQQVLQTGTLAGNTVRVFGTGDVLFLSDSGVRSLRVLNVSLAAGVTDVGSPIDPIIQAAILANPVTVQAATSIIEPLTGRYWVSIGNVIYVLSYWPSAKINAWSTFTLPFNVDYMTTAGNRVFIRSGDTIYAYGGPDEQTYDNSVATVQTPLMDAKTPTTKKKTISLAAMVQGNWAMNVCMDPDNPTVFEPAANLTKTTYAMETIPFAGFGSHIGFKMTCSDASPALLGALAVRFDKSTEL